MQEVSIFGLFFKNSAVSLYLQVCALGYMQMAYSASPISHSSSEFNRKIHTMHAFIFTGSVHILVMRSTRKSPWLPSW